MYPAKLVVGALEVELAGESEDEEEVVGGSVTGQPVRERRKGGMISRDCDVGERIKRRRGLAIGCGSEVVMV